MVVCQMSFPDGSLPPSSSSGGQQYHRHQQQSSGGGGGGGSYYAIKSINMALLLEVSRGQAGRPGPPLPPCHHHRSSSPALLLPA